MVFDQQLHELWQSNDLINEQLKRYQPSSSFSAIVEQYFVVDNTQMNKAPVYILPDLSGHLLLYQFEEGGTYRYHFNFVGSRTSGFCINRTKRNRTFIIRFRPGILSNLTKVLGKESCNHSFPLAALFPIIAEELTSVFQKNAKHEADYTFLFQWLEKHLIEPLQYNLQLPGIMHAFLRLLKRKDSSLNVKTSAKYLGVSERYLHKITTRHLGINPNKALRIGRLTTSLEKRMRHPQYNWSDIAFLSAYADQSHMIEEYHEMLGKTPRQLQFSLTTV